MTKLLIALAFIAPFAHAANPEMTCGQVEFFQQDENGNGSFQPSDVTIDISASTAGKYGFQATVTSGTQVQTVDDVKVGTQPPQADQIKEITEVLLPHVNWQDVALIRIGNVGVKANLQDAAGIMIYELLDSANATLGKVATFGWSFGRCGI